MSTDNTEFTVAWGEGEDASKGPTQASIDAAEQVRLAQVKSDEEYAAAHRDQDAK